MTASTETAPTETAPTETAPTETAPTETPGAPPTPEAPRRSFRGTVVSVMTVLHQTPARMMQHLRETFPDASYVRVDPSMRILLRFDKYVRPQTVRKALPLYTIFPADFDAFGVKPLTGSACWGSIPRIGRPPQNPV